MTNTTATQVITELKKLGNKKHAEAQHWYFQTQKGGYGEGDKFLGIRVPAARSIAKKFSDLRLTEISKLANSKYHEARFVAIVILVKLFQKSKNPKERTAIFKLYLKLVKSGVVNNWDLVDCSAPYLGEYLIDQPTAMKLLLKLSKSKNLWEQRVGVMFTAAFIRLGNNEPTLILAEKLISHQHDLIHKATGWMLREAGKQNLRDLRSFLTKHAAVMPRTMLRYSIEKLPETERKKWLAKKN